MKKLTYLLLIVVVGCSQNTKTDAPVEEKEKPTLEAKNHNPALDQVKNLVATDSILNSLLQVGEKIIAEETFYVAPVNDTVGIYLVPMQDPVLKYYLLFTTNGQQIISLNQLNGAWIDNDEKEFSENFRFLSGPLIYQKDLSNDGKPELIIRDRVHNGTYNAAVKHLYSIRGLDVEYMGDLEYVLHLPISDEYIVRHWDTKKGLVEVYLKESLHASDSLKVGAFGMSIKNNQLQLSDLEVVEPTYEEFIVPDKI